MEFVKINPPSGETCMQYLSQYITLNGGYLSNPNATNMCEYCQYRTTDEFLKGRNIYYSNHWKNLIIFLGFTVFNVSVTDRTWFPGIVDQARIIRSLRSMF